MSRKKKPRSRADELLDELLGECKSAEDILGRDGLIKQLTKRALERALKGELTTHLGYEPHERCSEPHGNTRNGTTPKKLQLEDGEIYTPRDRDGSFEPQIVRKGQRRIEGLERQIIALYGRGLTTREIQNHLQDLYQVEVSAALISNVTAEISTEELFGLQPFFICFSSFASLRLRESILSPFTPGNRPARSRGRRAAAPAAARSVCS
jgi:transposase-like protein